MTDDRGSRSRRTEFSFASIEADGGYDLTRLKTSTNPTVTRAHRGRVGNTDVKNFTLDVALEAGLLDVGREELRWSTFTLRTMRILRAEE